MTHAATIQLSRPLSQCKLYGAGQPLSAIPTIEPQDVVVVGLIDQ